MKGGEGKDDLHPTLFLSPGAAYRKQEITTSVNRLKYNMGKARKTSKPRATTTEFTQASVLVMHTCMTTASQLQSTVLNIVILG